MTKATVPLLGSGQIGGQTPFLQPPFRWNLAFASELKALMALPLFKREIQPTAVEEFFALDTCPSPIQSIEKPSRLNLRQRCFGSEEVPSRP